MLSLRVKIKSVDQVRSGQTQSGEPWASRDFTVVEANPDNPNYPQKAKFTLFKKGEYTSYVTDKFPSIGSVVDIDFNLSLNEGTSKSGRPFAVNELKVWSLRVVNGGQNNQPSQPSQSIQPYMQPYEDSDNDLPF